MTTATKKNELIESGSIRGAYDMPMERMIIHHHEHGRLLLSEGFGGMDSIRGGAYRYAHGTAKKISDTDTLESLAEYYGEYCGFECLDDFGWSGKIVAKIAESVRR